MLTTTLFENYLPNPSSDLFRTEIDMLEAGLDLYTIMISRRPKLWESDENIRENRRSKLGLPKNLFGIGSSKHLAI